MTKHKWHKEIKAWADGAEIEARTKIDNFSYTDWTDWPNPHWEKGNDVEYRIKPQPKEPQYLYVYRNKQSEHISFLRTKVTEFEDKFEVLGKIKLEVDDATNI
jgi:hypothetical protein